MSASRGTAARQAAPVFAALGDTTRLGLVRRLSTEGPLSITRLSEGSGMTRQAITRHLHALGKVGLVRDTGRAESTCSRSISSGSRSRGSTSITSRRSGTRQQRG